MKRKKQYTDAEINLIIAALNYALLMIGEKHEYDHVQKQNKVS